MRIVTWNCNGALRRKFHHLDQFRADIIVVQECEDPERSESAYAQWAGSYVWEGKNKNKGIGIFVRDDKKISKLEWDSDGLEQFLPVKIGDDLNLLAVWTKYNSSPTYGYIGQFWKYLQLHKDRLLERTIICGDFNSNSVWDKPRRHWNHSDCIRELGELGLESLYHSRSGEGQGSEISPTLYLHRNKGKPYHIDYIFAPAELAMNDGTLVQVGHHTEWLGVSDHMPLIADLPVSALADHTAN